MESKLQSDLTAFFRAGKLPKENTTETLRFKRDLLLGSLKKIHPKKQAIKIYNSIIKDNEEYQLIN